MLPAVTVVIPCFNQAQYLGDAIRSVRAQLRQPVHCIVVDDGSTDETVLVASSLGVQLIQQPNRGVSEARTAGLAAARTEFVVFLDADDELLPDAIPLGVDALTVNAGAAAVVGRCQPMDSSGRQMEASYEDIDTADLYGQWLSRNFVWTPGAAMFRRAALQSIGGFPAGLGPAADYGVYLQLARAGRVVVLPKVLVRYRQHELSMSRDPALMLRATLEVLRRESRAGAGRPLRRRIRDGRSVWCKWYAEQIVDRLRKDWHAGLRGRSQLRAAATLLRHCPRVVLRHAARKAACVSARLFHLGREQVLQLLSPKRRRAAR
jgi:hypothetical protein